MVRAVKEDNFNLPKENELKKIRERKNLSAVTLESSHRLIVRNDSEILVPKKARERMCRTLHFTHHSDEMMMQQAKDKIFCPNMRSELRNMYDTYKKCRENRPSKIRNITKYPSKTYSTAIYQGNVL